MGTTTTNNFGLIKHDNGDEDWGNDMNDNLDTIDGALSSKWTPILSDINIIPDSASTITTTSDLTGLIKVGYPLKYTIGGLTYYGIITAITSNLISIAGVSLSGTITAIYYADTRNTEQISLAIGGYYADDSETALLETDKRMNGGLVNRRDAMYIVQVTVSNIVSDFGATPATANITIGGADLLSSDLSVGTTDNASVVEINSANYEWARGEAIEIGVTAGINGDAQDLKVDLVAVIP